MWRCQSHSAHNYLCYFLDRSNTVNAFEEGLSKSEHCQPCLHDSSSHYYGRLSSLPSSVAIQSSYIDFCLLLFKLVHVKHIITLTQSSAVHKHTPQPLGEKCRFLILTVLKRKKINKSAICQHATSSLRCPGVFLTNRPALEHIRSNSSMKSPIVPCARLVFDG